MIKNLQTNTLSLITSLSAVFFLMTVHGQTTYNVSVNAQTFSPANITITVGDMVTWTNSGTGLHNINGTAVTYPSNPVPFGNTLATAWTYSFVFSTPGDYAYRCDEHFGVGMVGTISVQTGVELDEIKADQFELVLYPNPTQSGLSFYNPVKEELLPFTIYGLNGEKVQEGNSAGKIIFENLSQGVYFFEVQFSDVVRREKFVVQ